MEKGQKIYYSNVEGSPHIHTATYQGETSRSWLVGSEWRPSKLPKKTTVFKTEEDFKLYLWASRNSYRIREWIGWKATPQQLKQIAELIDYKEEESNGRNT